MALLADVHCHLDDRAFSEDIAAVLERASAAGVKAVVCNGISPESNRAVLALSRTYPLVKPALGLYPIDALRLTDEDIAREIAWIRGQKCVAIGEVGLDHKWSTSGEEHERQERIFSLFLGLAAESGKPLIIHSRKAERECIDMVKASGLKRVMWHCFGGRSSLVEEIRDAGWCFSVPTSLVRDEHFQRLVKSVPLRQVLTETDAPYQGPEQAVRNEPANVRISVERIAGLKGLTFEETANQLFANYLRLFG